MKPATVDIWIWLLIYGGMLLGGLSFFVSRSDAALGGWLGWAGAVLVAGGGLLIYLRSRMRD